MRKEFGGRPAQNHKFPLNFEGVQQFIKFGVPRIPEAVNKKGLWNKLIFLKNTFNKFYPHISAIEVKKRIDSRIWNSYTKFCVERNPWDKTVSHYYWIKRNRDSNYTFDDYIREGRFCWNYPYYTDEKGDVIVDRVLKYENLNSELSELLDYLGIPFNGLEVFAKKQYRKDKRPYQEFFSGENKKYIDIIGKAFQKEIKLHGYDFWENK